MKTQFIQFIGTTFSITVEEFVNLGVFIYKSTVFNGNDIIMTFENKSQYISKEKAIKFVNSIIKKNGK